MRLYKPNAGAEQEYIQIMLLCEVKFFDFSFVDCCNINISSISGRTSGTTRALAFSTSGITFSGLD